jgi:7,8-dihydropterin-6-yl-methyl-4-(beta-D-ribofuranosyl)aminobenzene 5'-phosphate synthase
VIKGVRTLIRIKKKLNYTFYMKVKLVVLHKELEKFKGGESGFCVFIEAFNKKILFDTSFSDIIIKNSEKLGINLLDVDYIVLSHGHWDHTNGLKFLEKTKGTIIAHPDCFEKKYRGSRYIGSPFSKEEIIKKFKVVFSKNPYFIDENIVFLGQIPRKIEFESKEPIGKRENGEDDFVLDDSALIIKLDKGLIIISGCSHAGICNIIEYAKEVCNESKIYAVLGGFHLFNKELVDKTIEFIEKQNIDQIYPAHCLSDYAFSEFEKIDGRRLKTLQKLYL